VCARVSAGAHQTRRSSWLESAARVEGVVVGVLGGQQLGLLVPWMNSPRLGDPPGAVAPSLVHRIVGNVNGVRRRSHEIDLLGDSRASAVGRDGKGRGAGVESGLNRSKTVHSNGQNQREIKSR
jgi:hypothetical protein